MVMRIFIFNLLFLLFLGHSVFAQEEVSMQMVKEQCIVGDELAFAIIVSSSKQINEDFSEIKYNNNAIEYRKEVSQQFYSDGRVTRESYKSVFIFSFKPIQEGVIELPSMSFKINDKSHQTQILRFKVSSIPQNENFSVFINLKDKRDFYYPTETIDIEIVLALKKYVAFQKVLPVISGFGWFENQGLHYMPNLDSNNNDLYNVVVNNRTFPLRLLNTSETVGFGEFQAIWCMPLKFRVIKPGIYSADNFTVKAQAITGKVINRRTILGNAQTNEVIEVYGKSNQLKIEVKPLPEKNKPLDFGGAIGVFNFEVVSSSDTDLKVGDPVTLHINVIGKGAWEFVNAPDLNKMPSITDFFRLANEMPAGVVDTDGRRKEFNVKLRVKSTAIKEIPAIPFSYFDIEKGQYVTKYSKPIPIKVFENSNKVEVVTFNTDENQENKKPESTMNNSNQNVEIKEPPLKPIEIMAIFKGNVLKENHSTNYLFLYLSYGFLFLILCILLLRKIIKSGALEKAQAGVIVKKSNSRCIERLTSLERNLGESETIHKRIGDCLDEFFKIRFLDKNVYQGLNSDSLKNLIANKLISVEVGQKLMEVFERWEGLKYSRTEFNPDKIKQVLSDFKKVIGEC